MAAGRTRTVIRVGCRRVTVTVPTSQYGPRGSIAAGSVACRPGPITVIGTEAAYWSAITQRPRPSLSVWWAAAPAYPIWPRHAVRRADHGPATDHCGAALRGDPPQRADATVEDRTRIVDLGQRLVRAASDRCARHSSYERPASDQVPVARRRASVSRPRQDRVREAVEHGRGDRVEVEREPDPGESVERRVDAAQDA